MIVREECRFVSKRKYKKQLDEREDMRIKLAILENDHNYLNRIVSVFSTKYAYRLVIFSFTDLNMALETLEEAKIDVLIADDSFDVDVSLLPKRCSFAYFVDSADINSIKNQKAICRFQKVDLIYKQVLSIYSENATNVSSVKLDDESTKIIIFSSPNGGGGTSSLAASCATHYAMQGKKTLYLNLERFGSADTFFGAEGMFCISDIIYALKSKKTNLSLKLESCVRRDNNGVYFYSQSKNALDMLEMGIEDIICLISELKITGSYDYIVIDKDFGLERESIKIFEQAHALVWVGDGTDLSNNKILKAYNALLIMGQNAETDLTNRLGIIYNKSSNVTEKPVCSIEMKQIGSVPFVSNINIKQMVSQLAQLDLFENII